MPGRPSQALQNLRVPGLQGFLLLAACGVVGFLGILLALQLQLLEQGEQVGVPGLRPGRGGAVTGDLVVFHPERMQRARRGLGDGGADGFAIVIGQVHFGAAAVVHLVVEVVLRCRGGVKPGCGRHQQGLVVRGHELRGLGLADGPVAAGAARDVGGLVQRVVEGVEFLRAARVGGPRGGRDAGVKVRQARQQALVFFAEGAGLGVQRGARLQADACVGGRRSGCAWRQSWT